VQQRLHANNVDVDSQPVLANLQRTSLHGSLASMLTWKLHLRSIGPKWLLLKPAVPTHSVRWVPNSFSALR
jgi:hypothetical protein